MIRKRNPIKRSQRIQKRKRSRVAPVRVERKSRGPGQEVERGSPDQDQVIATGKGNLDPGQREDHQAGKGLGRDPEIGVDPLDDPGLLLDVECRHIVGATRRHEGAGHRLLDAAEGHLHEGHRHPDIDLHGADPHHQGGTDLLYDAKIVPAVVQVPPVGQTSRLANQKGEIRLHRQTRGTAVPTMQNLPENRGSRNGEITVPMILKPKLMKVHLLMIPQMMKLQP